MEAIRKSGAIKEVRSVLRASRNEVDFLTERLNSVCGTSPIPFLTRFLTIFAFKWYNTNSKTNLYQISLGIHLEVNRRLHFLDYMLSNLLNPSNFATDAEFKSIYDQIWMSPYGNKASDNVAISFG